MMMTSMPTLTDAHALAQTVRRILATRVITPAQERSINQALWQDNLNSHNTALLEKLVNGIEAGEIIVLSQVGRKQTLPLGVHSETMPNLAIQQFAS